MKIIHITATIVNFVLFAFLTGCSRSEPIDEASDKSSKYNGDWADYRIPPPRTYYPKPQNSQEESAYLTFVTNSVEMIQRKNGKELEHNMNRLFNDNVQFERIQTFNYNGYTFSGYVYTNLHCSSLPTEFVALVRIFGRDEVSGPYVSCPVSPAPHGLFVIPEHLDNIPISSIDLAFFGCSEITKVVIPSSVRRIGFGAFSSCSNIASVVIQHDEVLQSSLTIEDGAFANCVKLNDITLPESLVSIGYSAFENCKSLVSAYIPPKVEDIGGRAFAGCTNLLTVSLNSKDCFIRDEAFADCNSIQTISLPPGFSRSIDESVFKNAFTQVPTESGIVVFGNYAFDVDPNYSGQITIDDDLYVSSHFYKALRNIKTPFSLRVNQKNVQNYCFLTNLSDLTIGPNVERIHVSAFSGAMNLTNLIFEGLPSFIGKNAFDSCDSLRSKTLAFGDTAKDSLKAYPYNTLAYALPFATKDRDQFNILLSMLISIVQNNNELGSVLFISHSYNPTDKQLQDILGPTPLAISATFDRSRYLSSCGELSKVISQLENLIGKISLSNDETEMLCLGSQSANEIIQNFGMGTKKISLWDTMTRQRQFHDKDEEILTMERYLLLCQFRLLNSMAKDLHHPCSEAMLGDYYAEKGNVIEAIQHYQSAIIGWAEARCPLVDEHETTDAKITDTIQLIDNLGYRSTAELLLAKVQAIKQNKQSSKINNIKVGSGWYVNEAVIVTCRHLIENCTEIWMETQDGSRIALEILAEDTNNDIAILKAKIPISNHTSLPISSKLGTIASKVFTVGYPLPDIMGSEKKYNDGTISSLSGIGNDNRFYQISIPIQPGNSGGAVVSEEGLVIGLAAAALDAEKVFKMTGSIPQNVNYAIKSRYITALLQDNGIPYDETPPKSGTDMKTIVDQVSRATILLKAK